jgi:hypothetical protein
MKINEAVSILRAHNAWRRSPAHLPRGAMGDPRKIGIAIDTVCDALSQSDDWSRALRLADDAAESVICNEGHSPAAYHWVLTHEHIAADPYLEDCIAHLEWRGIARRFNAEDGVIVIFVVAALGERLGEKA